MNTWVINQEIIAFEGSLIMKEIFISCDSPCFSCPVYSRVIKINDFRQRKLPGAYYCPNCDIYSLCKMGLAYRRYIDGTLKPVCTKCGRMLHKIELSYTEGQDERPFNGTNLLVIREPTGGNYKIHQTVKGGYFKDLSEVLLYVIYTFGPNIYNIVRYDTMTKSFHSIYTGMIQEEKIIVKSNRQGTIDD